MYTLSTRSVHFIHEYVSVIKIERFHLVDKLTLNNVVFQCKNKVDEGATSY